MFGYYGKAMKKTSAIFVSQVSIEKGIVQGYGLGKYILPVVNCRDISKADMVHNHETPKLEVNPQTYEVKVDGKVITCEPIAIVPLAQKYFMF